ncbi:hypothetical protein ACJZ2D_000433 [Fusarium nematophilum]
MLSGMFVPYFLLSLAYLPQFAFPQATQTIASGAKYRQQRSCATGCFWNGDPDNDDAQDVIGMVLDCCDGPTCPGNAEDSCYCRADLRSSAVSWLSTCVIFRCTNTADFSSAVNIYDDYCGNKGDSPTSPADTEATITSEPEPEATAANRGGPGTQATVTVRESGSQATVTITESGSSGSAVMKRFDPFLVLGLAIMVIAMGTG